MANIGIFTITKQDGYIKLEEVIKAKKPDFAFIKDSSYLLGIENTCRFCVKTEKPDEREGFLMNSPSQVAYTHAEDTVWVLALGDNVKINVAE